jgi:hypothetical protein
LPTRQSPQIQIGGPWGILLLSAVVSHFQIPALPQRRSSFTKPGDLGFFAI